MPVTAAAEDIVLPSDSGVVDVQDYGAKGDGVTDDTAAIQNAIGQNIGSGDDRTIYFPNGRYLVSGPLYWKNTSGVWGDRVSFRGESQAGTVIKLVDGASGFASSGSPMAVIYTASANANPDGSGEEAYGNNISHLTVDTGHNNPGAVGVDYQANNQGVLKYVTIQSDDGQGYAGLALDRSPATVGPCLIKAVTINGFNFGIFANNYQVGITFYNITLNHQNTAGIYDNHGNPLAFQDLTSNNTVPVIEDNFDRFLLVVSGGSFTGGSSATSAIVLTNGARAFLHNVAASGYNSAISNSGAVVPGTNITDWASSPTLNVFPSPQASLGLPIQDTPPTYLDTNFGGDWANIQSYGACKDNWCDATSEFQAAIDSGKPIVYIPLGHYVISQPIHIRGNVQTVIQFGGQIVPACNFPSQQPGFQIDNTTASVITLDHFLLLADYGCPTPVAFPITILDASPNTLVVKDSGTITDYQTQTGGAGPVFMEDVTGSSFNFDHQTVWIRQLDPENPATGVANPHPTLVTNNGGTVWILGLKAEFDDSTISPVVQTTSGGQTEILGAVLYPHSTAPASTPAFVSIDSSESLAYSMGYDDFQVNVQETRSGITENLYRYCSALGSPQAYPSTAGFAPQCGDVSVAPLFTGY